jgi:hypothetical protein
VAAETGAATALFGSTALGAPVSTTHTVAGAVTGVGAATRAAPVNWTIFGQMALHGVVTSPAAALAAAGGLRAHPALQAGNVREQGQWAFWDVCDPERAIIIHLANERYARLVIEVDDPAATEASIRRALLERAGAAGDR